MFCEKIAWEERKREKKPCIPVITAVYSRADGKIYREIRLSPPARDSSCRCRIYAQRSDVNSNLIDVDVLACNCGSDTFNGTVLQMTDCANDMHIAFQSKRPWDLPVQGREEAWGSCEIYAHYVTPLWGSLSVEKWIDSRGKLLYKWLVTSRRFSLKVRDAATYVPRKITRNRCSNREIWQEILNFW